MDQPPDWPPAGLRPLRAASPGDLPGDVQALARLGCLVRGPAGVLLAADACRSAADRAGHLRGLLPAGGTLALETAAWVHLGGPAPKHAHVMTGSPRRATHPSVRVSRARLSPWAIEYVGGSAVTTAVQTAADLARAASQHPETTPPLVALLASGVSARRVRNTLLSDTGRPRLRQALEHLAALAPSTSATPRSAGV